MKNGIHSDSIIALQFRDGSEQAFECIYNKYYATIYLFAKKFVYHEPAAEEISVDAFIKLWHVREGFNNCNSILGFLRITTRNACFDYLKNLQYRTREQQQFLATLALQQQNDTIEYDDFEIAIFDRIGEEISKLPPLCRKVFTLAFIHGLKNAEIAGKLKLSITTVANKKSEALKILRIKILQRKILLFLIVLAIASPMVLRSIS